ncbi:cysteine desulfurase / selenocysteine lyase [Oceanospirillum multiglobuliferum]|uniref:Cysteine desulfurase n=1 Tax=Oceanospirillum multiglobuliferum TaxID=64969 RepID=A0A1T4M496_9GAMM|nr:cysteine sulfinate desulfinase [Oceanospirillum multiglobuliferum]SJZ61564.1 cysteine desulfurase / selenocysteine lyase [Oceanospirillum multiglobuliferum]
MNANVKTQPQFNEAELAQQMRNLRSEFPLLTRTVHGKSLVYFDNSATVQKPDAVIDSMNRYYREQNANIHRGVHYLSGEATDAYEKAREQVRQFINARSSKEIIFVRGTTEAINLVANTFGRQLKAGDEVIVSMMEHHANIVPWQMLRDQLGIVLKVAPVDEDGELDMAAFNALIGERTKLISVTHISNALGTINPVKQIVQLAHLHEIPVLLDGAQAVPHLAVDVQDLDCDFYAFSGHKMYGPTGVGILYGKEALLEQMPPWQGGGDMIDLVTFEKTTYADLPHKFEAGTPAIAEGIALGVAAEWLTNVGLDKVAAWEDVLLKYATQQMLEIPGMRIIGNAQHKAGVISFVMDGVHAQDLGVLVDQLGVAIRTGHHCAMPVLHHFGVNATARASFALYNTKDEVDSFIAAMHRARDMLL